MRELFRIPQRERIGNLNISSGYIWSQRGWKNNKLYHDDDDDVFVGLRGNSNYSLNIARIKKVFMTRRINPSTESRG